MSTETLERATRIPVESSDIIVLETEPNDARYGTYRPGRRLLGSMAASAAAGELLRRVDTLVAPGDRPDPEHPQRNEPDDEWPEDSIVKLA